MCGRYVIVTKIKEIEKRFGVTATNPDFFTPNANVTPGQFVPVITSDRPSEIQFFRFGFTPSWSKKNTLVINARVEGDHNADDLPNYTGAKGILEKPMFRKAIRSQRCLVIADAFIEGPKTDKLNKPYCVYLKNGQRPFAMAGIYDRWLHPEMGVTIDSFAILTTGPNTLMQKINHHRCPFVLHPHIEKDWINSHLSLSELTAMMQPFPGTEMNAYPISSKIKSPKEHDTSLLEPIGERVIPEYTYEIYNEIKMFGMGETRAKERREGEQGRLF